MGTSLRSELAIIVGIFSDNDSCCQFWRIHSSIAASCVDFEIIAFL